MLNNPLIFNDFTGESFWRSVGRWFKKNWKQVVTTVAAIAVTVAVTVLTAGTATPFVIGLYAGGAGGLTSGILGTALNGGSLTDILINGALGAATGALFGGVGSYAASFAPAGIVNGALYGAASNAALGGLADLAMGGDGVRGALWGGAIGLVSGGYTGFAKAKAAGANVWSGKVKGVGGSSFGKKLFLSEKFGITSKKFGSSAANAQGTLNKGGGLFKAGWSTGTNSSGQWGYKFRIGIGSSSVNSNISRFHLYVPKSFVPNSFANPSIQVKRSIFNLSLKN